MHGNERGLTTGARLWWWQQWAGAEAAALAVGCCGGGGTTGSGHGTRQGQVTKLGARMRAGHGHDGHRALAVEWLRRGCREPGHWRA